VIILYTGSDTTYMNCGKAYNDICEYNDECSSNHCVYGICTKRNTIPSKEGENTIDAVYTFYIFIAIVIIIFIICCLCYYNFPKSRKYLIIIIILFILFLLFIVIYRLIIG